MKQKFLTAILLLLSLTAPFAALADSFKVLETDLELGKTGTLQFVLENSGDVYGFQAEVTLPTGLTAVAGSDGQYVTLSDRASAGDYRVNSNTRTDGSLIFGTFSANHKPFTGTSGAIAEMKVSVAETFKGGDVKVSNIKLINAENKDVPADDAITNLGVAVTAIELSKTSVELKAEETAELTAIVKSGGVSIERDITWESDKEDVAKVDPETGKVTAVSVGTAVITAKYDENVKATCNVTVIATPVESISFTRSSLTLKPEGSTKLVPNFNPATATDKSVTWKSSNPAVATVDDQGVVSALTDGETTITATTTNGKTATCVVTVKSDVIDVTGITLNKETLSIIIGQTGKLTATVTPENASDKSVHWSSTKPTVATVDDKGNITTLTVGTTTITAEASNGMSTSCEVTVEPILATSVTLTATTSELKVGETLALSATVSPDNTTFPTVAWSSSDEKIVTVDKDGKVTAVALGEATITASCNEGEEAVSGTFKVSVVKTPVATVTISKETLSLTEEETATLTASVAPENATYKTVTWTTSEAAVATVDENGKVTAVAPGEATITATADGVEAKCVVTVNAKVIEISGVTLNKDAATLTEGETLTLEATIEPANANTDKTLIWTSSDEAVATVADGVVTAVKAGTATITVTTANEKTATCAITVEKAPVAVTGITLSKTAASIAEGENLYLLATVAPADATDKTYTWSSSDESVATVAANGKVTALKAGTATITATSTSNAAAKASCTVTVSAKDAEIVSISWPMTVDGVEDLSSVISEGAVGLTAGNAVLGSEISCVGKDNVNGVDFAKFQPSVKVLKATEGHTVTFTVETAEGYTFQPTGFEYIATKLGTDGGTYDLDYSWNGTTVNLQKEFQPNRNNVGFYSPESISITDADAASGKFEVTFSIYNLNDNKQIGLSNIVIKGKVVKGEDPVEVTGISLSETEASIVEGKSVTLVATVTPEDAADKTVTWSSSDENIATVDADGKVTAVAVGTATITAKAGEFSASCVVTVTENLIGASAGNVKMTYVNMDDADKAYGEIAAGETAMAGYNKISGGEVGFANTGWDVNNIAYLQVNTADIEGTIIGATLSFEGSGSTDSKRTTSWGVGYNSSVWSADMTYNTADKSITTMGATKEGSSKSASTFDSYSFDIIDAVKHADEKGLVTILVYETAAAGGYIKNPAVTINWTKESTYNVTFAETNEVEGVKVAVDGLDVTNGTALLNGTYSFTATAPHYKDYTGNFTVAGEDLNVEFTMTPKATWNYTVKNNVNDEVKTGTTYEGESATVAYNKYILKDGTVYTKGATNQQYNYTFTPDANNFETTLEYSATETTDAIYFVEGEDIEGMTATANGNAGVRGSNALGGYAADPVAVYTLEPGKYIVKIANSGSKDKTMTVKAGEETVLTATTNGSWSEFTSEEFEVIADTELTFEGAADGYPLDYILIRKTGEYVPVTGITLSKTTVELEVGGETQLTATAYPADATHAEVTWTSSNEDVATVDENGTIKAIGYGTAVITAHCFCGEETADCTVKVYPILGDATMDGEVDITDAVDINNYVVGRKTVDDKDLEFYLRAANANGDAEGKITAADASATVCLFLEQESSESTQARVRAFANASADALVIGTATVTSNGTVIPVALDNSMEYVALQADIILPEGANVDVKEGSRVAGSHILTTRKHGDNHIRIAIYNLTNEAIADNDAPIFEITTDSNISASDIVISNIIASDIDAKGYTLTARTGVTTGVAAIGLDENAPVMVFDLNGVYVSDTMEGLQQGTYIVRQGNAAKTVRIR